MTSPLSKMRAIRYIIFAVIILSGVSVFGQYRISVYLVPDRAVYGPRNLPENNIVYELKTNSFYRIENGQYVLISTGGGTGDGDSYWERDSINGYLFPKTITDMIGLQIEDPRTELEIDGDISFRQFLSFGVKQGLILDEDGVMEAVELVEKAWKLWADTVITDSLYLKEPPYQDQAYHLTYDPVTELVYYYDNVASGGIDSIDVIDHEQFQIEYLRYMKDGSTDTVTVLVKPHGVIEGGHVSWISDTTFNVESCLYFLYGDMYISPEVQLKISSGDPTNPRIDIVVVSNDTTASIIEGVPGADPVKPQIDPATQLELTQIFVPANAEDFDTLIYREIIYDENVEWTGSSSGVTVNFASTTAPYRNTYCADVGTISNADEVIWTDAGLTGVDDFDLFTFHVKLKATMARNQNLVVQFYNGSIPVSAPVVALINKSSLDWQMYTMNLYDFSWSDTAYNKVVFRFSMGGGTHIGLYLDYIKVEIGLAPPVFDNSIILVGDVSGTGVTGAPVQTTLATVNPNVGTFGDASNTVTVTADAKGRILAISETPITEVDTSYWSRYVNTIYPKPGIDTVRVPFLFDQGNITFDNGDTRQISIESNSPDAGNHLMIQSGTGSVGGTSIAGNIYITANPFADTKGNTILNVDTSGAVSGYTGVGVENPQEMLDVGGRIKVWTMTEIDTANHPYFTVWDDTDSNLYIISWDSIPPGGADVSDSLFWSRNISAGVTFIKNDDDVSIAKTVGKKLMFGDRDTYINESDDDDIQFYSADGTNGSFTFNMAGTVQFSIFSSLNYSHNNFLPWEDESLTLGSNSRHWSYLYTSGIRDTTGVVKFFKPIKLKSVTEQKQAKALYWNPADSIVYIGDTIAGGGGGEPDSIYVEYGDEWGTTGWVSDDDTISINKNYWDLRWDELPDHGYCGLRSIQTSDESITLPDVGHVCYMTSNGKIQLANHAYSTSMPALYLYTGVEVYDADSDGQLDQDDTGWFLEYGYLRDDSRFNFTIGQIQYVGNTDGTITPTAPTTINYFVQVVGIGQTADIIKWNPQLIMISK